MYASKTFSDFGTRYNQFNSEVIAAIAGSCNASRDKVPILLNHIMHTSVDVCILPCLMGLFADASATALICLVSDPHSLLNPSSTAFSWERDETDGASPCSSNFDDHAVSGCLG